MKPLTTRIVLWIISLKSQWSLVESWRGEDKSENAQVRLPPCSHTYGWSLARLVPVGSAAWFSGKKHVDRSAWRLRFVLARKADVETSALCSRWWISSSPDLAPGDPVAGSFPYILQWARISLIRHPRRWDALQNRPPNASKRCPAEYLEWFIFRVS